MSSCRAFGFSDGTPHLPQPDWFAECSVSTHEADPHSTPELYRRALGIRAKLHGDGLVWVPDNDPDVLHFARQGWHCITNFGSRPVALPAGTILITSAELRDGQLPPDAAAWILTEDQTTKG